MPRVKLCALVVPRTPVPVRKVALLAVFAEILAVGVPEFMFVIANFAEPVELLPSKKSCEGILSKIAPFAAVKGEPPLESGRTPVTSVDRSTRLEDITPLPLL